MSDGGTDGVVGKDGDGVFDGDAHAQERRYIVLPTLGCSKCYYHKKHL